MLISMLQLQMFCISLSIHPPDTGSHADHGEEQTVHVKVFKQPLDGDAIDAEGDLWHVQVQCAADDRPLCEWFQVSQDLLWLGTCHIIEPSIYVLV